MPEFNVMATPSRRHIPRSWFIQVCANVDPRPGPGKCFADSGCDSAEEAGNRYPSKKSESPQVSTGVLEPSRSTSGRASRASRQADGNAEYDSGGHVSCGGNAAPPAFARPTPRSRHLVIWPVYLITALDE